MTNKRFTNDIHRIYDDEEQIACADTMDDAETIVDLLNEQDERIRELEDSINNLIDGESFWEKKAKERIKELESFINKIADDNGDIVLINGYGYNIKTVMNDD